MTAEATALSLAAWCDLDVGAGSADGTSFTVREFALLSDGREVTLSDDRGWTTSRVMDRWGGTRDEPPALEHIERSVFTVVLPDDAEETGEQHEWELFAERLREVGVEITPDDLRRLPYHVILSDRLRSQITPSS